MALVSLRQLLDYAAEHNFAVPAFNVSNMEQVQAIMQAADACDSPVIMHISFLPPLNNILIYQLSCIGIMGLLLTAVHKQSNQVLVQ
ncbi:MAG: hypothetical protein RIQ94_3067 [Pseudomonadota bacterium]